VGGGTLDVFRQPAGDEYKNVQLLKAGAHVSPQLFSDLVLSVAEVLGLDA
jgi:Uma2 family endonuclease